MRRGAATWLLLALAPAACGPGGTSPWQQPPQLDVDLRITVEPTEVALLQPLTVTIDRYRRDGVEVVFAPAVPAESFLTRSTTVADERPLGDGHWQRTTMVLLPIAGPGELEIPPLRAETVVGDGGGEPAVATTPAQMVAVTSALAADDAAGIEAPGEPFPTPFEGWWWVGGAAAAVLLLAALVAWRRGGTARQPLEVAVPAHVRALRELQRWRAAPRTTPAQIEAFYVGVSQVLRVYLEERFGLHAPERTTEEFLRDLEGGDGLARQHRADLERFLSQCDLVKFAALVPAAGEHDTTYELAEAFVENTRADRVAAPAAEVPA